MSSIPPIALSRGGAGNPCCQPSAPPKDAKYTSAEIKTNNVCKLRSECATIVNLRADRIVAEDVTVNTLIVNNIVQPSLAAGDFVGAGDGLQFQIATGEENLWVILPAATLSWSVATMANGITANSNTFVVDRDGIFSLSLNMNSMLTGVGPLMVGWSVNGTDPAFRLFQNSPSISAQINNASLNVFLTAGSTVQLAVNTSSASDELTVTDAHASFAFLGSM